MKKHIKGFISGFLVALVLLIGVTAIASPTRRTLEVFTGYNLFVDGVRLVDERGRIVEPFGLDGNLYVPAEEIARAFGKSVNWQASTQSLWLGHVPAGMIPIQTPRPRETVRLSDLNYLTSGGFRFRYESSARSNTDRYFNDCFVIGENSSSPLSYRDYLLEGTYSRIEGTYFLGFDSRSTSASYRLKIWGDGNLLYESDRLVQDVLPISFSIDVNNVQILKIGTERETVRSAVTVLSGVILTER